MRKKLGYITIIDLAFQIYPKREQFNYYLTLLK